MRALRLFAAAAVIAVVAAACSSSPSSSGTGSGSGTTAAAASTSGTVNVEHTSLGTILDNSSGKTLYMFAIDTPTKSKCNGSCATYWPPLTVTGTPSAGTGVTASMLTTITRSDGSKQVVYNGHPLYTYAGDAQAHQTKGQGLNVSGGLWYVIASNGHVITAKASSGATTTTGSSGGYGY